MRGSSLGFRMLCRNLFQTKCFQRLPEEEDLGDLEELETAKEENAKYLQSETSELNSPLPTQPFNPNLMSYHECEGYNECEYSEPEGVVLEFILVCRDLGRYFSQNFNRHPIPKSHILTFHAAQFMACWFSVGIFAEQGCEALHGTFNRLRRKYRTCAGGILFAIKQQNNRYAANPAAHKRKKNGIRNWIFYIFCFVHRKVYLKYGDLNTTIRIQHFCKLAPFKKNLFDCLLVPF